MCLLARTQVRLVVGPASRASLREAGSSRARMVVVRAGKSFPDQEASDADAEHIGQLVEVRDVRGGEGRVCACLKCEFNRGRGEQPPRRKIKKRASG